MIRDLISPSTFNLLLTLHGWLRVLKMVRNENDL